MEGFALKPILFDCTKKDTKVSLAQSVQHIVLSKTLSEVFLSHHGLDSTRLRGSDTNPFGFFVVVIYRSLVRFGVEEAEIGNASRLTCLSTFSASPMQWEFTP